MKIKYWPNKPSIYLNNTVVELFLETEKKLSLIKKNKTNKYLYLDILNYFTKNELLQIILYELKELTLDLIEINIKPSTIRIINRKINQIFINRVSKKFIIKFNLSTSDQKTKMEEKNDNLTDYLLIYLIFGTSSIKENVFIFERNYTPYKHVKILLENFVIEISNIVIKQLVYNLNSSNNIAALLQNQKICNKLYSSKTPS